MNRDLAYQKKQLKKLRENANEAYESASIYTILMDLCETNGTEEVFIILHNVACDFNERELLESMFEEAKKWKHDKDSG